MRTLLRHSALALTLAFSLTAIAQTSTPPPAVHEGHDHHHDPAKETAHLAKKLNLTPDQTAQVQPILAERQQRMHDLLATNPDRKAMHQQRMQIMQDTAAKLNGVLTPAQQQQFAAMQAHHHHHHDRDQAAAPAGL